MIERTGAKKGREDLANSAVIVDYGTGSTGYGTYSKKIRKSKDWSAKGNNFFLVFLLCCS